jgi:hypothetical protein
MLFIKETEEFRFFETLLEHKGKKFFEIKKNLTKFNLVKREERCVKRDAKCVKREAKQSLMTIR